MSFARNILPVAAFGISLAGTLVFHKTTASITTNLTNPAAIPQGQRTKAHREESTFAAVRALLRKGDIEAARELLRQLSERDPVAFFKLVSKLPGLPGMEEIIRECAGRLPWNQASVTELLNGISTNAWRDLAWNGYITPRVGVLPDAEIYQVGVRAREYEFMSVMGNLFKDAAENRPDAFLAFLNTGNSTSFRQAFFEELMKFHPERAAELFHSIPDGCGGSAYDKAYILQTRIKAQPTAKNLEAVLLERGDRGIYDWSSASFLASSAYPNANADQKVAILEWIGKLPPIARNRLLDGIVFSTELEYNDPIAPAEFSKVLDAYTSGYKQERALDRWLKRNKDLVSEDPGWVDSLPTERLRNYALDQMKKLTQ